ncbi:unnamed protein product [Porites lobata]|uniref:Selenide, water dikinase n=1 Tax=Porites lobata TaxID=104759 RepID=A0ABN8S2Y1_9CNID|nr:unnamed protein product [Porites lobata]|mmetsp:Transcript_28424/g.45881  ORF Transcript_28424/g.45881 Transcript_28424/m.45881 type:complete len:306 (-) Transcript_28424:877-1794(-)
MDSCVLPTRHEGIFIVQTTDFFYPLVDDPYMQGKIACANVLSDLYAMGVTNCDNMLMLLGVSNQMTLKEREVVTPLVIKGFNDLALEAGTTVNGGQTVLNPWFIVGGVASGVVSNSEFIMPENAVVGDVLVLTKPLGTQIAVNAHQWLEDPKWWARIKDVTTTEEVEKAYQNAMQCMARLNRNAADLMHKYDAHGATDVTGFGILGHARNLVANQKSEVSFVLHTLPILANMVKIFKACGVNFKLLEGYSAETSGGLLVCLTRDKAQSFCDELQAVDGHPAWIVGEVVYGNREVRIDEDLKVIEV